jgi:prepilin-type N-terminal cleavage/methylation domain-containing protein
LSALLCSHHHQGTCSEQEPRRNQKGFTLIELMISTIVLMVGALSVATLIGYSIKSDTIARHDTIAMSALEHEIERLRGLDYINPLLADGGSTIATDGKISFSGSAVTNYSASVAMANEEQSGKTYNYDVRWNISTITGTGSNMKKITIAAQQQGGNWRFKPVQLSILKCR